MKRNNLAESEEEKKEEEQKGQCMNYTFSPQSAVPALFMSQKAHTAPPELAFVCGGMQ